MISLNPKKWEEINPKLFEWSQSKTELVREGSIIILNDIVDNNKELFKGKALQFLDIINKAVNDQESKGCRDQGFIMLGTVLSLLKPKSKDIERFSPLADCASNVYIN